LLYLLYVQHPPQRPVINFFFSTRNMTRIFAPFSMGYSPLCCSTSLSSLLGS
jgi:hypothetical protein